MAWSQGHHLEVSAMLSTLHLGAHADAPSHYDPKGESIEQRPLGLYMGAAQVVRAQGLRRGARVGLKDLSGPVTAPRVLIDTGSFPDPDCWQGDFNSLEPALIEALANQGVRLVGIDTPSVDPADSKALESHQVLRARNLAVLEGLCLVDVPEGLYTLVALPLPIEGGDASPVRAVLLPPMPDFPELL